MLICLTMFAITVGTYFAGNILLNIKEEEQYRREYYEKIEQSQSTICEIKHNMKNKMIVLKALINNGNNERANQIINEITQEIDISKNGIYTENLVINSIIKSKINNGKAYNIEWNLKIDIPKELKINPSHIGVILGNLLDNAIEACSLVNSSERIIVLNIYCSENSIIIYVKNRKNKLNLIKKNKRNHGIGLKSVSKIVKKYNGSMENKDLVHWYEVSIILWN